MSIQGPHIAQTIRRSIAFIDVNCPQLHKDAELSELLTELRFYLKWTDPVHPSGSRDDSYDQNLAALRQSVLTDIAILEGALEGVSKRKTVRNLSVEQFQSDKDLAAKAGQLISLSRTIETASLLATKGISLKFLDQLKNDVELLSRASSAPPPENNSYNSTGSLHGVHLRRAAAAISVLNNFMNRYLSKNPSLLSEWREVIK